MPWQQREVIQFCLILLCVPLQYYLSGFFDDVKDNERSQIIISAMQTIERIKEKLFNIDLWSLSWNDLVFWAISVEPTDGDGNPESGDKTSKDAGEEVPSDDGSLYNKNYDLIARWSRVRSTRPDDLLYRVGQTVQLTDHAYRGIIVGWDHDEETGNRPMYTVLLDQTHIRSGMTSVLMEVQQDKLYAIRHHEVLHRYLDRYFSMYDGTQYIPRDWLRRLYPKD